jgi:hypothetical protein
MTLRTTDTTTLAEVALADYPHRPVVLTISDSHAYGFPSANSDLGLRGMPITPIADVFGVFQHHETAERKGTRTVAVTVDDHGSVRFARPGDDIIVHTMPHLTETVAHDVATHTLLLLKLNGNALEQLSSPYVATMAELGKGLRDAFVPLVLTKVAASHSLGFAQHEWIGSPHPTDGEEDPRHRPRDPHRHPPDATGTGGDRHQQHARTRRDWAPLPRRPARYQGGGVATRGYCGVVEPIERAQSR